MPRPSSAAHSRSRVRGAAGVLAATALLVGCGAAGASNDPTWVPQRSPSAVDIPTVQPPGQGGDSSSPPSSGSGGSQQSRPSSPSQTSQQDPIVVATKLNAPTGVAVLPDSTALVGERTTGVIKQVQPVPGKPVRTVRTVPGIDASGGGGLLDLALSPSYAETGLILALITTATDTRVVQFTQNGPVTAIVTGIPRGTRDNTGRLYTLSSTILVGTGDAGQPTAAADPNSLAGKVLRVDDLGRAANDNPTAGSRVYTSGHRTVDGLCADARGRVYQTQGGPDVLNRLEAGGEYSGTSGATELPSSVAGVGGCAIAGRALYVAAKGGKAILQAPLDQNGRPGTFTALIEGKYGRILTVVAAEDGSLWATTTNKDGQGTPVADDERVLHITPSGGGGSSPV